jgi:hypothetical protein
MSYIECGVCNKIELSINDDTCGQILHSQTNIKINNLAEIKDNRVSCNSTSNTTKIDLTSGAKFNGWKHQSYVSESKLQRGSVRVLDEKYYTKSKHLSHGRNGREHIINGNYHNDSHMRTINNRITRKMPVIKTTVQNLNLEYVKPQRAGIIIYTVINGSIYFGLGLDAKTHDLTDFGGGVIYKKDINVIRGAIREFEEETLEIFDTITVDDLKQCPVIYDNNNLIIFVHMDLDPDETCRAFHLKYKQITDSNSTFFPDGKKKIKDPEVCGITWLTWEEFQQSINEKGIMFSRVQRFLSRAEDFSYLL